MTFRPVRNLAQQSDAAPEAKTSAGLRAAKTPSRRATPNPPANLTAQAQGDGIIALSWQRGENGSGTLFVIEAKIGAADWALVDVVSKTSYLQYQQTPGVHAVYHVRARRRDQTSEPSNEASVYAG